MKFNAKLKFRISPTKATFTTSTFVIIMLSLFFFFLTYLFILFYFWLCWVFAAARRLSLVAASGSYSSLWCVGFSSRWLLLLRSTGSRCVGFSSCGARVLECRLSSCAARTQLLRGMWDLPGPGLEPLSPALAGRFLTTVSPWKFALTFLYLCTIKGFIPNLQVKCCLFLTLSK